MHWHKECHRYIYENPHKVINKYSFCSLFAKAWIKTMTSTNIMKAFQTTSVYPLNKDAVKMSMKCSIVNEFADKCVLYIPLHSTAVCHKNVQFHSLPLLWHIQQTLINLRRKYPDFILNLINRRAMIAM